LPALLPLVSQLPLTLRPLAKVSPLGRIHLGLTLPDEGLQHFLPFEQEYPEEGSKPVEQEAPV